jgi:hypothetical protein
MSSGGFLSKMTRIATTGALALLVTCACKSTDEQWQQRRQRAWLEPCRDSATLLATTTGSPSKRECPNRMHRLRIEVASGASNEEYAAVVFCECQRPRP